MKKLFASFVLFAILSTSSWAVTKTVTLSVPGMTCSTCPVTVKKALTKVDGVIKTKASLEKLEAIVTFDDAKTNPQALIQATTNAGYPSQLVK